MAFNEVVEFRLEKFIEALKGGQQIKIDSKSKLGDPPIGFDSVFLAGEFRLGLNGNRLGFGDLLKEEIKQSEVQKTTAIEALTKAVIAKSSIKTNADYKVELASRLRGALGQTVSQISGIEEGNLESSNPITQYTEDLEGVRDALNRELAKYLLSQVRRKDLEGTFERAERRMLARMVV